MKRFAAILLLGLVQQAWAAPSSSGPVVTDYGPKLASTQSETRIDFYGSNFGPDTQVKIAGIPVKEMHFVRSDYIFVQIAAGPAGLQDIEIIVDGQSLLMEDAVRFINPPEITAVSPNHGPAAGGTTITVTGKDFWNPADIYFNYSRIESFNLIDATHISFVTPDSEGHIGYTSIQIYNEDGQSGEARQGFLYEGPRPTIQSITPNSGNIFGSRISTITGTNFNPFVQIRVGTSQAVIRSVSPDGTTVVIDVPDGQAVGRVAVSATNPDNQKATLSDGYTYLSEALTITGIAEARGPWGGGGEVSINGTGFQPKAVVYFGSRKAVRVFDENSTYINAIAPNNGGPGTVDIRVVNPDNTTATLPGAYTYTESDQSDQPRLNRLSEISGSVRGGDLIYIEGDDISPDATFRFGGVSAKVIEYFYVWRVLVQIPPHAAGEVDVEVINPDGQSNVLVNGFTYRGSPRITSLSPRTGPLYGGPVVTVTGFDFVQGVKVRFDGTDLVTEFVNDTTLRFTLPAINLTGQPEVAVVGSDDIESPAHLFFYNRNDFSTLPVIQSVSPNVGPLQGGTVVTVRGINFDLTSSVYIDGINTHEEIEILYRDATTFVFVTPPSSAGHKDVIINNGFGQTGYLAGGFQYTDDVARDIEDASSQAHAMPNPYKPSETSNPMTLFNLSVNTSVKIYTRRGELVRELFSDSTGAVSWDVKDSGGAKVASGAYTVYSEGNGQTLKFKIAIIR